MKKYILSALYSPEKTGSKIRRLSHCVPIPAVTNARLIIAQQDPMDRLLY
jgi:hypothetical protein